MDFKVVITQAALNDLDEIVAYISQDSPRAARRMANDLVRRAESLLTMPRRGPAIRGRSGVRRLIRHPYLSIYQIEERSHIVNVLRFWHQAREPKSLRLD